MSEEKYLPSIHYIVAASTVFELPGPDKKYVEILGSYESLQDAKHAVEAHAHIIMDNDKQHLTIYKVNLEENKVYDFYRKDLTKAVEAAYAAQRMENEEHILKSKSGGKEQQQESMEG